MTGAPADERRMTGRTVLLILAAVVAAGVLLRAGAAAGHDRVDYDEGRYLDNAVSLLEGKGLATHTLSLFFGDPPRPPRPEDISSPLYPVILAGLFLLTGPSFTAAKVLGVLTSVAMIPAAFLLGRRLYGEKAGLVAASLLALQPDQAIVGAWAMTEALYGLLVLAALLVAAPLVGPGGWSWGRTVAAGLMCGLLFLARQNGAAVAAALAFLVVADPGRKAGPLARRLAAAAVMTAVALALCAPWFARNISRFGSPTFSRIKNVAWAEHARSLYDPSVEEPSMERYIERHGTAGLLRNVGRRVLRVTRTLLTAERGPFRWIALLGLLAPLFPALRARSLLLLLPTALTALLLLGVATWSGALPRYFLPVRALLYVAGGAVLLDLVSRGLDRFALRAHARTIAAALTAAVLGWAVLSSHQVYAGYLAVDASGRHAVALEAAQWIRENTEPGEVLMEGGLLHQYAWIARRGVVWIPLGDMDDVKMIARRYDASYLAATPEALRFRPRVAEHWRVEGTRIHHQDLPGWLIPVLDRGEDGLIIYRIELPGEGGP